VDFLLELTELLSLSVTAESLRAKKDRKSAISLQCGHFEPKFQVEGSPPPIIFAQLVRQRMPYTLLLTVFTQKNFVADFLQAKCDFLTEIGRFVFLRPPLGDLGATYDNYLSLI